MFLIWFFKIVNIYKDRVMVVLYVVVFLVFGRYIGYRGVLINIWGYGGCKVCSVLVLYILSRLCLVIFGGY